MAGGTACRVVFGCRKYNSTCFRVRLRYIVMIFLPYVTGSYGEANALSGILSMISCSVVAFSLLRYVDWKNLIFPLIGCAVLTVPAVLFMTAQSDRLLLILLGAVLMLLSVYFMMFSGKVRFKPTPAGGLLCGGLSGVMGGMFAMGGPPVVVWFMQTETTEKLVYLATIQMYFVATNIYGTAVKAINGLVTPGVLILSLCGIAGLAAGLFIES